MINYINFVIFGFLVIGLEWIIVFIVVKTGLIYKFMPKSNSKDYSIAITNNGWDLHIPSQNPLDFINMIVNKITGEDATTQEYIQQNIKNIIKTKSKNLIEHTLQKSEVVNKKVKDLVLDQINQELFNKK